jgi:pterin-4a-carbinolamine dehydratase
MDDRLRSQGRYLDGPRLLEWECDRESKREMEREIEFTDYSRCWMVMACRCRSCLWKLHIPCGEGGHYVAG